MTGNSEHTLQYVQMKIPIFMQYMDLNILILYKSGTILTALVLCVCVCVCARAQFGLGTKFNLISFAPVITS